MIESDTADAVASIVAQASRDGHRIVIRGGGTKSGWCGASTDDRDIVLSTARLDRVLAHRHGDLTATIEAGATLADVNRELARHGQWLALDPAWSDRATIGGIVATNDAGPRRHRYGSPRDLIIGVDIVRADGVRAKAGGIVVKNVAGYDLARLMTGSFGCLGVIVSATFKLYPLTPASATVVIDLASHRAAGDVVSAIDASQLTPTAVELQTSPLRVLVRFESTDDSVEAQAAAAVALAAQCAGGTSVVRGEEEQRVWHDHGERPWKGPGAIAKVTILPSELAATLDAIRQGTGDRDFEAVGRAALGVLLVRIDGDASSQAAVIAALRAQLTPGRGSVVLLRGSAELIRSIDVWGPMGDGFPVMQAVKRAFDPHGTLNARRGPGGV